MRRNNADNKCVRYVSHLQFHLLPRCCANDMDYRLLLSRYIAGDLRAYVSRSWITAKKKKGMIDSLVRPERKGAVSTSLAQHVIASSCGKIGTEGVTRLAVNPFFLAFFSARHRFSSRITSPAWPGGRFDIDKMNPLVSQSHFGLGCWEGEGLLAVLLATSLLRGNYYCNPQAC